MLFADTFYWIALLNPGDAFHARVTAFGNSLGLAHLATTDEVLTEMLNWFSRSGPHWRGRAAGLIHDLRSDPDVAVLPQTRVDFDAASVDRGGQPGKWAYAESPLIDGMFSFVRPAASRRATPPAGRRPPCRS
jgi:hypothetical protein